MEEFFEKITYYIVSHAIIGRFWPLLRQLKNRINIHKIVKENQIQLLLFTT